MVEVADHSCREWVAQLSEHGSVAADASDLHAAIATVEAELPPGRESVLTPTPPAPKVELREVPREPAPAAQAHNVSMHAHDAAARAQEASMQAYDAPAQPRAAPDSAPSLQMPMIELPEVGAPPSAPPFEAAHVEFAPPPEAHSPQPLSSVNEITIGDVAAAGAPSEEIEVPGTEDEVAVGEVTLSSVLFGLLIEEGVPH